MSKQVDPTAAKMNQQVDDSQQPRVALSIRQPWAWLVVNGYKDIENRTWVTDHRGVFLVHAAQKFDQDGYQWVRMHFPNIEMPDLDSFKTGGIIGQVELIDCVQHHDSPWFEGPYGFVLDHPRQLAFTPLRGQLGFFSVDS